MGVLLSVNGKKAILRHGEWRCADAAVERALARACEEWIEQTGGPALDARDPELEAAQAVAARIGARVLMRVRANRRREAQNYLVRRQMSLPFGS
jgi:hypothetical protein